MKSKTVQVKKLNGEVISAMVVSKQGDNMTVRTQDGYIVDVERDANRDGVHVAYNG